mgnify:FL=1
MTNETLETIKNRRSCRAYKPEQITNEELDAVLEAAPQPASIPAARATLITTARNLCMVFIEKELLCLFSARPARRVYHIMGAPKNQGTAQIR